MAADPRPPRIATKRSSQRADARAAGMRISDAELVAAMTVTDEELLAVLAARAAV